MTDAADLSVNRTSAEPRAHHHRPARTMDKLLSSRWLSALTLVLLIIVWEGSVHLFEVRRFLLPAPSDVVKEMIKDHALILNHLGYTLTGIAGGYAAAVVFALAVSMLMIRYRVAESMLMPIFISTQTVPKIAIAPLILLWVGAGIESKILVVTAIAFFPIVINTMAGFKSVDQNLLEVFRSVDATERQIFFRLRLPYAVPFIFAGLRIATTLSVLGVIVAEWLAASNGLGYLLLSGSFNFNTARSFAAIVVLAAIGMSFFGLMSLIEQRFSWRPTADEGTSGGET